MDASETGLGAVLSQDFDGEEHPIIFASHKLTPAEQCYTVVKREALAIKWALEELHNDLMGHPFMLVMDHILVQWMSCVKDTNSQGTRWLLSL